MSYDQDFTVANLVMANWVDSNSAEEQLFDLVLQWLDFLAAGDFERAYQCTLHRSYFGWSSARLRKWIEGYGWHEPNPRGPFRVSDRRAARKVLHTADIYFTDRPYNLSSGSVIGSLEHAIPLNGEWSDLVAQFEIVDIESRRYLLLGNVLVP